MSIPTLFGENATDFNSNGIGRLYETTESQVKEKINGEYELEMKYPITGTFFNDLKINRIIVATIDGESNVQPFSIYEISEPINGQVTIYAEHISYRLKFMIVAPFQAIGTPKQCWEKLKENALTPIPFNFESDIPSTNLIVVDKPTSVKEILQGTEGSFLDQFGGEYEWDGWTIRLHKHRGQDNGYSIRYGSNLTDLTRQTNNQEAYSGIVPYITQKQDNGITVAKMLPEKKLMGKYAASYPYAKLKAVDLTSKFKTDNNTPITEDQIRSEAKKYISNNQIGKNKISLDIKFVNLADTIEYKNLKQRNIKIGDSVHITEENLNLNLVEEVTEINWDSLRDKYKELHLGDPKQTLITQIRTEELDKNQQISNIKVEQQKDYDTYLAQIQSIEKQGKVLQQNIDKEREERIAALEKEGLTREQALAELQKEEEAKRKAAIDKLRSDLSQDYKSQIGLTSEDLKKHFNEQLNKINQDFTQEMRTKVGEEHFNKIVNGIKEDFEKAQGEVDQKWSNQVKIINSDINKINQVMSSDTTGTIKLIRSPNNPTEINQLIIQNNNGSSFQMNGNGLVYRDRWGNITTAFTADGHVAGSVIDGAVVNSLVLNSAAISAGTIEGSSISGTAITGGSLTATNIYGSNISGGTIVGGQIYGPLEFYTGDGGTMAIHIGADSYGGLYPQNGGEAIFVTSQNYTSMVSSGQVAVTGDNGTTSIHPSYIDINNNTALHTGNWDYYLRDTIKQWVQDWVADYVTETGNKGHRLIIWKG
ncbi:phage minor structural protein [Lactobacillus colini]|uniref:Phage minor structural protein n=1 Tax=Lactobacillus colini TaxID=1819254 RepID=A0ABS4MBG8_9LACO|nr:phage tail spike protein [Lactobacillus colini]MBP2057018.1 phage minor structural protein [Lactobacillus colini]